MGETRHVPSTGASLRTGIIGAGFIGAVHARAARRAGARVLGIVASTPASTAAASAAVHAEQVYESAEQLIADDRIDVVHVCTPNDLHLPLTMAAIEAGKHVVCEKPLATSLSGAVDLYEAAAAAGVVATVPFAYRFYPMIREARARRAADASPLRLIHGAYLQDWLSSERDSNWRVDAARGGPSRAFADIGSHWCDLVEFVSGDRIVALCAETIRAIPERVNGDDVHAFAAHDPAHDADGDDLHPVDTEDAATVMFRTARGVHGSMLVSQISSGRKNELRLEFVGSESTIAFEQERPDTLWIGRRVSTEIIPRDAATLHPDAARYVTVPVGHPQGYQECFDLFVADTYVAIADGSTDVVDGLPTFADGVRTAQITDAVLRSAASHAWVDVDPALTGAIRTASRKDETS